MGSWGQGLGRLRGDRSQEVVGYGWWESRGRGGGGRVW